MDQLMAAGDQFQAALPELAENAVNVWNALKDQHAIIRNKRCQIGGAA